MTFFINHYVKPNYSNRAISRNANKTHCFPSEIFKQDYFEYLCASLKLHKSQ